MSKTAVIVLSVVTVLLLGSTAVLYSKYRETSTHYASAKLEEETTRARYGEAINSIAAIQDSLNTIIVGDRQVPLQQNGLAAERRLTGSQADEAMERIAVLKLGIDRTKERINALDAKLKHSGIRVVGLQRMIVNLKRNVKDKENDVVLLTGRVDSLQNTVTGLVAEVEQNHVEIQNQAAANEEKRRELGTIYYLMGPTKMLKQAGVVEAKGGVLGLGKVLKPTGRVNETLFTQMDTDVETTVRIPSDKVKVLSAQPVSSYTLEVVGENAMELRITDPREFRKVKHLVILTS